MRTGAMWSILLVFVKTSFALSAVNKIVSVHFEKLGNKKRNQITEVKEILVNDFFIINLLNYKTMQCTTSENNVV